MKKIFNLLIAAILPAVGALAQNAWINEIHYDNASTDVDEFIEVVIENPGSYNLSDFKVNLYNGNNGASYDEKTLDLFTVGATEGNFTFYYFNYTANTLSIQNGAPDGMSLSYTGTLIAGQFLSYEGVMTATDGPASGVASTDIGVSESSTTTVGQSLQVSGSGNFYGAFTWQQPATATPGALNNGQTLGAFTPDPEPTNYPTGFTASAVGISLKLNWTDATGDQLPDGYLVIISNASVVTPNDGNPVADDPDASDGSGALNVAYGTLEVNFDDLAASTPYNVGIFPYTNAGQYIDFKTDGTAPSASGTTQMIIHGQNFEGGFPEWTTYSVTGDQVWVIDSVHGISASFCAKMSGYSSGATVANEDWLISPSLNLSQATTPLLKFASAMNYGSDPSSLLVLVSNNYTGGDPTGATWTDLSQDAAFSAGNWLWTRSGYIDIAPYIGDNVHLAFKYTSVADSRTWEIDNVFVTGIIPNAGIHESTSATHLANIYPNPARNWFFIDAPADEQFSLSIYNNGGTCLMKSDSVERGSRIQTNTLSNGIYLVILQNLKSGISEIHKLSIQR